METRYARLLDGADAADLGRRLAAAATAAGAEHRFEDPHLRAVDEVGRWVAAPLLVPYVLWLLSDARERGLGRLYFVARDGQVLLAIARRLAPRVGFDGELRYLYGSRRSWEPLLTPGAEAVPLVVDYLRQEGLCEPVASGLVDIGWQGTLHGIAAELQHASGAPVGRGYVFGSGRKKSAWASHRRAFAFDVGVDRSPDLFLPEFHDISTICEVFAAADHGTVIAFERRGGRVVPRCADGWATTAVTWGVPTLQRAMVAVATHLDLGGWTSTEARRMARTGKPTLRAFWLRPTMAEARAWAAFTWDDGRERTAPLETLAEPFGRGDLARLGPLLLRQRMRKRPRFWIEGALRLTPWPRRAVFTGVIRALRLGEAIGGGRRRRRGGPPAPEGATTVAGQLGRLADGVLGDTAEVQSAPGDLADGNVNLT
jgi:hypothetical protein